MQAHKENIYFYGTAAVMIASTHLLKKQTDSVGESQSSSTTEAQAHCVESDMFRVDSSLTIPISKSFLELPKYGDMCNTGKTIVEMTLRLGAVSAVIMLASTAVQRIDL